VLAELGVCGALPMLPRAARVHTHPALALEICQRLILKGESEQYPAINRILEQQFKNASKYILGFTDGTNSLLTKGGAGITS
jgi:hypothetical protein